MLHSQYLLITLVLCCVLHSSIVRAYRGNAIAAASKFSRCSHRSRYSHQNLIVSSRCKSSKVRLHVATTSSDTTTNSATGGGSQKKKLPVTVLSGFLGAGKTTLLQHILRSDHNGKRYAVIVNDMSVVNIDGSLVKAHIQHSTEKLVEMSNGCICCTLREDLLKEVSKLAREGIFDHLIIESTGVSEPLPVAETFTFQTDEDSSKGESLLDIASIDSMVTVIDAVNFRKDIQTAEDLRVRNMQADEDDVRTITDLLVSQVEFASIIIINKCDLINEKQLLEVKRTVRALNSEAKIIESIRSNIDISEIIGSNTYNFDKISQSPAWIKAINDDSTKVPETEEYGISSFVYKARRPFHPQRLMDFVNNELGVDDDDDDDDISGNKDMVTQQQEQANILRSKGFFWLASRPEDMMVWSQAGGLFQINPGGNWWIDTPKSMWPDDKDSLDQITADWDKGTDDIGDRRQELVFIGTNINKDGMIAMVDKCLLTDDEMQQGKEVWVTYTDPFPETPVFDDHDHDHDHIDEDEAFHMIDPKASAVGTSM